MGFITDILKEVPLSAVLRERLTEAEKNVELLRQENANLHDLVKQKDGEIDRLKNEIESFKKAPPASQRIVPDDGFGSCRIEDQY